MILEKKENSTTSWLVQELNPVMIEPIELYFIQPLGGADLLPGNGKSIIFAKMV